MSIVLSIKIIPNFINASFFPAKGDSSTSVRLEGHGLQSTISPHHLLPVLSWRSKVAKGSPFAKPWIPTRLAPQQKIFIRDGAVSGFRVWGFGFRPAESLLG
jgi:hypothetical protein